MPRETHEGSVQCRQEMEVHGTGRSCCGKYAGAGPCVGPAVLRCGSCGAPNYCSLDHQMAHWRDHRQECSRMAEQMMRAGAVHDFPFSFAEDTTQLVDVGAITVCSFLENCDLHLKGLWKAQCDCASSVEEFATPSDWQLPSRMCPCTDACQLSESHMMDWASYYSWRSLPLESPVALILHWPLTLYHAFCLIWKHSSTFRANVERACVIHYLGPEKELDMLEAFSELLALLPHRHVHIDMIGPGVSASRDGKALDLNEYPKCLDEDCLCKTSRGSGVKVRGRVTIKLWRGLYHERYSELETSPHFIFAPNAGLAAFPSWQPTLRLILSSKVPAIFTDYCEEAADLALRSVSPACSSPPTHNVQLNPFRQPLCPRDKQLNLPTYSNCFLFGIN
ncbi:zinc finger MYND domain-containing protein 15 [Marchantia polymorpha subsp. ruderalis]|uniref:MYND-type domain-containing protein n=4 Tax=Marchantia polymorpha TaxID=3197 RepID=A0AAF6BSM3_MARPO|nr:hypothetical protein MARPO_0056s0134 [Marchantia polymorpha]BBN15007.1 hypothetical protein Mp_6g16240 [Marchantia polymorpha subsp. ruderalis]|eukprot:PTQ37692.1 hypothetical protein MARPO_0056s0134 [Marchantia polymorpha]